MVRPVMSTSFEPPPTVTAYAAAPLDRDAAPIPVPRDAGHAPAEAASALTWRNQHLLHPQMLGRSVVMH